jgi:MoaA/NifB/PqqE/SkfB family radical SAM enzyme
LSLSFLFILPTTDCRARCPHCFYENGHTPRVEAAPLLERLDGLLEVAVAEGLQQIVLTGGEPLLSPQLEPIVRLCASKIVHLLLLTRGDLLDDGVLERLEAGGLDDVTLSALEPGEELRATVLRVLFHSRFVPTLLSCLTRQTIARVPELLELSSGLGLPHLLTTAYIPRTSARFEELSLHAMGEAERERALDQLEPWAEDAGARPYLELVRAHFAGLEARPSVCPMGTEGVVLDADGALYPCFHRHDLRAGNLLEDEPRVLLDALLAAGRQLAAAPCFGEHCLSMFVGMRERPLLHG